MANLNITARGHHNHRLYLSLPTTLAPVAVTGTVHWDVWCATCGVFLPETEYDAEVARAPRE